MIILEPIVSIIIMMIITNNIIIIIIDNTVSIQINCYICHMKAQDSYWINCILDTNNLRERACVCMYVCVCVCVILYVSERVNKWLI